MLRPAVALACLIVLAEAGRAASPDPADLAVPPNVHTKARALVKQLGSDSFAEREAAQEQLAAMGRMARPALLEGAAGPDPEVQLRCGQLLPNATALHLKAQIDTFLADTTGKYDHDLPGWKTFRAVACREWTLFNRVVWSDRKLEQAARQVFAGLLTSAANRRLLVAINDSPLVLGTQTATRRLELYNLRYSRYGDTESQDPSLEDVTALLFAESQVGSQLAARRTSTSALLSASGFNTAARGPDDTSRVYRNLAGAWVLSRTEPREMSMAMNVAFNLDLTDDGCAVAARLVTLPGVTASYRGRAASGLVAYGGPKHIRLLGKAFDDPLVVYSVRIVLLNEGGPEPVVFEIQLRDLALAVSIQLAGQKPEDFGFTDRFGIMPPDYRSFSYSRYYFPDEATRRAAFAKWQQWRDANLDD